MHPGVVSVRWLKTLKNQGLILRPPACMMADALDHPTVGLCAQPLPCVSKALGKKHQAVVKGMAGTD